MMKKVFIFTAIVSLFASMAMGGLAGYWKFDEGTGTTAADSSGNTQSNSQLSSSEQYLLPEMNLFQQLTL